MIGRLILLAIAATLAGCGAPQADRPPADPALWEVQAPDGETGWLFGTIHSLPDGVDWRTAPIDEALAQARLLVVEIANLNDHEQAQAVLAHRANSPGLPPLSRRVPAEDRPVLARLMERAGLDDDDFRTTESWAAALALGNALSTGDAGNGVDRALLQSDLPVTGLESFDAQFARFDTLPEADQIDLLLALEAETAVGRADALRNAWLTGDMEAIERLGQDGLLADPQLREALLTDRNRSWVAPIATAIESGRRPFVAVGAAHMAGDEGLPALLAARGYTVRRIR